MFQVEQKQGNDYIFHTRRGLEADGRLDRKREWKVMFLLKGGGGQRESRVLFHLLHQQTELVGKRAAIVELQLSHL